MAGIPTFFFAKTYGPYKRQKWQKIGSLHEIMKLEEEENIVDR